MLGSDRSGVNGRVSVYVVVGGIGVRSSYWEKGYWSLQGIMLKQRKLDEALRAGAASRRVHVDKVCVVFLL